MCHRDRDQQEQDHRTRNHQRMRMSTGSEDSSFQNMLQSAITGAMSSAMSVLAAAGQGESSMRRSGEVAGPSGIRVGIRSQPYNSDASTHARSLPTSFNPKRRKLLGDVTTKQSRNIVYDRDIVCLPNSFLADGKVTIPRSGLREELASNGLIGKIRLYSSMNEAEIFDEVRSVFRGPMNDKEDFKFTILQPAGGGSKSLIVPALSPTYQYTSSATAGKNSKMPIYILALDDLKWKDPVEEEDHSSASIRPTSDTTDSQFMHHRAYIDLVATNESDRDTATSSPPTSPISISSNEGNQEHRSLEAVLTEHQRTILDTTVVHRLNIRRHHIYSDSLKAFKKRFSFNAAIRVVFLGEPAVDCGGPLREYFTLLMKEILSNNSLFNGPDDCQGLVHSMRSVESKAFFYIGQMMAVSILHGGPGPGCLSHPVVDYLTFGLGKVNVAIDDVADAKIQEHLKCIESCEDTSTLQSAMEEMEVVLHQSGNLHLLRSSIENKYTIIREIAKYFSVVHVKAELDDLQKGLAELGILNLLRQNPVTVRALFVATHDVLTAEMVQDLFKPDYSPSGSNQREHEEELIMYWINLLQEIEDSGGVIEIGADQEMSITFENILAFATGAHKVPPTGFLPYPQIQFQQDSPFPTANTCGNCLNLPILCRTYHEFKDKMAMAIMNAIGFGQV